MLWSLVSMRTCHDILVHSDGGTDYWEMCSGTGLISRRWALHRLLAWSLCPGSPSLILAVLMIPLSPNLAPSLHSTLQPWGNTLRSGGKGKLQTGGAVVPSCYGGHLKADSPDTKNIYVLARAESKGSSAPAPLISKGKLLGNIRCRRYPPCVLIGLTVLLWSSQWLVCRH